MKLCRYADNQGQVRIGVVEQTTVTDVTGAGISQMQQVLESKDPLADLRRALSGNLPRTGLADVHLLAPVERQEVWAAGVTYLRSKKARMEESDFSATAYDRVYDAERPELFFKALPEKVIGPGGAVGIRGDSRWNVPEPELALVINSRGHVVGYTIGNDMSSRDIEGENLLYLPQAKIYKHSCALGPSIELEVTEAQAREWAIRIEISRAKNVIFQGETSVGQIKRRFEDLAAFLFRSQEFPNGAVLLTGTGIVPPDSFTLQPGDEVQIEITGIGTLRNSIVTV